MKLVITIIVLIFGVSLSTVESKGGGGRGGGGRGGGGFGRGFGGRRASFDGGRGIVSHYRLSTAYIPFFGIGYGRRTYGTEKRWESFDTSFETYGRFNFSLGYDISYTADNCKTIESLENCTLIEQNDPCPVETLTNILLDKLEVNDRNLTIFPILQSEALKINSSYNMLNFSVSEYIIQRKDDPSSAVNQMFENMCGLTNKWPPLVYDFLHFDSKQCILYDCDYCTASVPVEWWEHILAFFRCNPEKISCEIVGLK